MKGWLRWTILLTQVGGGLVGILVTLGYLLKSSNMPLSGIMISIVFIGLYTILQGKVFLLDYSTDSGVEIISSSLAFWSLMMTLLFLFLVFLTEHAPWKYWKKSDAWN